jgi:hypothetical protein
MRSDRGIVLIGMAIVAAMALSLVAGAKKHESGPPPRNETSPFYRVNGIAAGQMLFLRESADKDSDKVGAVPADGRCVRAKDTPAEKWAEVSYRGVSGFARTEYLVPDNAGYCASSANLESCSRKGKTFQVKNVAPDDVLWIHDQPAKTGNKIGAIPADGSCILYLGTNGEWYQISYHGVTGWVNLNYLLKQ